MGVNNNLSDQDINRILAKDRFSKRFVQTDTLIIDEISMIDGLSLDSINRLLKRARASLLPFGGIQVVLSGDFFQLPPVSVAEPRYAFYSNSWAELGLTTCYLDEQHRQQDDHLSEVLLALRERRFERRHLDLLMARQNIPHSEVTKLMTHNSKVDIINDAKLAELDGKQKYYQMSFNGNQEEADALSRKILAPKELFLKPVAKVMFVANNFSEGYVNGSQGVVVGFKGGYPVVELAANKPRITVRPYSWKAEVDGSEVAEVTQLPLRLAWAVTIHKSQGMSLTAADIDLSRSFTYGMGYVALSRLRSYEGLFLSGFNSRSLELDPNVYRFYDKILHQSPKLQSAKYNFDPEKMDQVIKALISSGATNRSIKAALGLNSKQLKTCLARIYLSK